MNKPQRLALCALLLGGLGATPAAAGSLTGAAPSGPVSAESTAVRPSTVQQAQDEPAPYEPGPHGC
jgi:hypothetical protein